MSPEVTLFNTFLTRSTLPSSSSVPTAADWERLLLSVGDHKRDYGEIWVSAAMDCVKLPIPVHLFAARPMIGWGFFSNCYYHSDTAYLLELLRQLPEVIHPWIAVAKDITKLIPLAKSTQNFWDMSDALTFFSKAGWLPILEKHYATNAAPLISLAHDAPWTRFQASKFSPSLHCSIHWDRALARVPRVELELSATMLLEIAPRITNVDAFAHWSLLWSKVGVNPFQVLQPHKITQTSCEQVTLLSQLNVNQVYQILALLADESNRRNLLALLSTTTTDHHQFMKDFGWLIKLTKNV